MSGRDEETASQPNKETGHYANFDLLDARTQENTERHSTIGETVAIQATQRGGKNNVVRAVRRRTLVVSIQATTVGEAVPARPDFRPVKAGVARNDCAEDGAHRLSSSGFAMHWAGLPNFNLS
jgi:hypothetical protein